MDGFCNGKVNMFKSHSCKNERKDRCCERSVPPLIRSHALKSSQGPSGLDSSTHMSFLYKNFISHPICTGVNTEHKHTPIGYANSSIIKVKTGLSNYTFIYLFSKIIFIFAANFSVLLVTFTGNIATALNYTV